MRIAPLLLAATLAGSGCLSTVEIDEPSDLGSGPRDLGTRPPSLDGGNVLPVDGGMGLASLWFSISDRNTGLPLPSRVIFRPSPGSGFADNILAGKNDPLSPGGATGATVSPGVVGSPEGVLLQSGLGVVPVPAGTYELLITRGPAYEAVGVRVTVRPGEVRRIEAELDHTVDTRGWLSADMHVHMNRSFDSKLPVDRRVISMVTNGVDVIVPTDHNVNTDLEPWLRALGYGPETVGTVPGNEFNFREGHAGVYPVRYDDKHSDTGGAPPWTAACDQQIVGINCYTAAQAFPMMRAQIPGVSVVTVNHPWWPQGDLGYFTNIDWGAGTGHPLPSPLATADAFDAMEVLNGYWTSKDAEDALVADWFYLLGQGHRITAVASSDTHRINWVRAGWPRTWLRLPTDRPGEVTGEMLADAIRHQRAVATTGPFLTFTVDGAEIGDEVAHDVATAVKIDITADAPNWIDIETVKVYVNGIEKHSYSVTHGLRPVFRASIFEPIAEDSWIVVLASSTRPMPPDIVGEHAGLTHGVDMLPWAITNPIYVHIGPQRFAPPGWHGAPFSLPPAQAQRGQHLARPVPVDCDPTGIEEPPLDSDERFLMPHLYQ